MAVLTNAYRLIKLSICSKDESNIIVKALCLNFFVLVFVLLLGPPPPPLFLVWFSVASVLLLYDTVPATYLGGEAIQNSERGWTLFAAVYLPLVKD